jgi:ribosomal protein S27AE
MGDAVSITKLNNSIAAEKRKMEGAYRELGQAYFDLHCDEQNGPLASLCASIKDALKKIEGYKDEIGVIRDMTNCPQCGAESPRSSAFCGKCGASLPHKPEPEKAPAADADEAPEESASADADEALEESAPANADEAPEESASADA